jgi:sulfatase maturation enzyme AslB (radical SAM superfamily)
MTRFCPLPFVSVEATPLGKARACCLSLDDIPDIDLRHNTLEQAFNSPYMDQLRYNFISGQHITNCQRCWDEEAAGRVSKRMHSINKLRSVGVSDPQYVSPSKLQFIDLKLGNICNLKCRICGSFSSSKWAAEEIAISAKNQSARDNLAQGRWVRESPGFWENLQELVKNVKYFEFTGGEPFLINEHFDLLAVAVMLGYSKGISIHYNTNTTTVPQLGLDLWPSFKHVEIALSIDDLGPRFEYQRYGATWAKTQDNLKRFFELKNTSNNIDLQLCLTVNSLNFFYIDEICAWIPQQGFDYVYFNVLHDAAHFSIKNLNAVAKKMIHKKFDSYAGPYANEIVNLLTFMDQGLDSDCSRLVQVLKQSDIQRNQKYSDHHPEMATAIGYDQ